MMGNNVWNNDGMISVLSSYASFAMLFAMGMSLITELVTKSIVDR